MREVFMIVGLFWACVSVSAESTPSRIQDWGSADAIAKQKIATHRATTYLAVVGVKANSASIDAFSANITKCMDKLYASYASEPSAEDLARPIQSLSLSCALIVWEQQSR